MKIYPHALEQTDFADDPYLEGVLRSYFPGSTGRALLVSTWIRTRCVRKSSAPASLTRLVNIGGITFAYRVMESSTSVSIPSHAPSSSLASSSSWAPQLSCTANCPEDPAGCMVHRSARQPRVLDRAVRWFITERGVVAGTSISGAAGDLRIRRRDAPQPARVPLRHLRARVRAKRDAGEAWGLPRSLIVIWIRGFEGYALLDVIRSARDHDFEATSLAPVHFATYDRFKVDELLGLITELPRSDRWEILARQALARQPLRDCCKLAHCPVAEGEGRLLHCGWCTAGTGNLD